MWKVVNKCSLSLADASKRLLSCRVAEKLLLIPCSCNCQTDIFLMGLHSTITRTPLLNEKPVTKWRRRTLPDPILKNWHYMVKNLHPWCLYSIFHGAVLVNKLGHTRVHLTVVRAPHAWAEIWAPSRSCASVLAHLLSLAAKLRQIPSIYFAFTLTQLVTRLKQTFITVSDRH